jgi:hypothetical protein
MNLNEAAQFLLLPREQIKIAIQDGIKPSAKSSLIQLKALPLGTDYDIDDSELDAFIKAFFEDEPKRQIPTAIRRKLLVEARHRCAICGEPSPLEFHHIIEYSKYAHHDPKHMIVLCGNCHGRCTFGDIDTGAQVVYKQKLATKYIDNDDEFPARFAWDDLKELISEVHDLVMTGEKPISNSKNDFVVIGLDEKNELNRMSETYFEFMRDTHQQYFGRIEKFLREPINEHYANLYYDIVDELNAKIASERGRFDKFEEILIEIKDSSKSRMNGHGHGKILNILLSFTYFKCDVGRKNASTD